MKAYDLITKVEDSIDCGGCYERASIYAEIDGKLRAITAVRIEDQGGEYEDHMDLDVILEIEP